MSERLIAAIPAQPGYFISENNGPWETIIAWGFSENCSAPIPITVNRQCSEYFTSSYKIKTPEGVEVTL